MANRTEQEIMQNWKYTDPPLVSVVCITYNHEPYIRDAIEGFLLQETDFPFEIIIHDDASTDRTPKIIRDYCERYPQLIIPIFQQENQYSKGENPALIAFSRAKGEFIAICEGDDYWIDPKKIFLQHTEMIKQPECHLSFHPSIKKDMLYNAECTVCKYRDRNWVFKTEEVILGGGGFCPTASLMIKKEVLLNIPEWFYRNAPVGDFFWQIFGSLNGGALYINHTMSVYRANVPYSWSSQIRNFDTLLSLISKINLSLEKIDLASSFTFTRAINKHKAENLVGLASYACKNKLDDHFKKIIIESWRTYPYFSRRQILLYYLRYFPFILRLAYRFVVFYKSFQLTRKAQ